LLWGAGGGRRRPTTLPFLLDQSPSIAHDFRQKKLDRPSAH
jgi:hypothetical protein